MLGLIPVIKVNYNFFEVIEAVFTSSTKKKYLTLLEKEVSKYFGVTDVLFTSSGRSALYHILCNLPQRKVLVPSYTCDVVVEAAMLAKKIVVYTSIDRRTFDMRYDNLIDNDTIVIATHQFGIPCSIDSICRESKEKGAVVVEDCAGSLGTTINGQLAGTFGDYAFFSLNASKTINAPAMGGFVISKDKESLIRLRQCINLKPCDSKYKIKQLIKSIALCFDRFPIVHRYIAIIQRKKSGGGYVDAEYYIPHDSLIDEYKYGFYEWQAKTVYRQFKDLDKLLQKRKQMYDAYSLALNNNKGAIMFASVSTGNRFPLYIRNRSSINEKFKDNGIGTANGFEHFVCPVEFVKERELAKHIMYLPFGSSYTEKEIKKIVSEIKDSLNE